MVGNELVYAAQIAFRFADCVRVFAVCEASISTRVCSL
jgi:hypothetical protein